MDRSSSRRLQLDQRNLQRLSVVLASIAPLLDRGQLSQEQLVSLVLDYWFTYPPDKAWVKGQANLYPNHKWRV